MKPENTIHPRKNGKYYRKERGAEVRSMRTSRHLPIPERSKNRNTSIRACCNTQFLPKKEESTAIRPKYNVKMPMNADKKQ